MKKQIKRTFAFSEELFSVTLHELRTPISSINGYSSILMTGEIGTLSTRQREFVQRIQELCQFTTTLIGNLLLLVKSSIQRPHTSKEFADVNKIANEVVKSLQGQISRKKLHLTSRFPSKKIFLWADPRDITQIFLNLLSNAVKFTPASGRIEVNVGARQGKLLIEVADSGVGMSPKSISRIFEEFYHEDHPEVGAPQGSGLGLAIVKRTVTSYGGKISVSSRLGRGSTFKIVLPVRSEQAVLEGYLKEVWLQAKSAGQLMGIILCQYKGKSSNGSSAGKESTGSIELLEQALRDSLRQEDRVFRISGGRLLAVLVKVGSKGFAALTQRLESALHQNSDIQKLSLHKESCWRLVSLLAPRQVDAPGRLLRTIYQRLHQSWGKPVSSRKTAEVSS